MTVNFTSPDECIRVGCQPPGFERTRGTDKRDGTKSGLVALVMGRNCWREMGLTTLDADVMSMEAIARIWSPR